MELRSAYDAVVLAYGAGVDRYMNIPGEVGFFASFNLVLSLLGPYRGFVSQGFCRMVQRIS